MADSTVSGLTAKTTLAGTDILYLVQSPFGSGDDRKVTFANLVASALATPTLTGAVTLTGGTVNGTVLDISQTWGGTGTYTGLKYNVTDSGPANAASLLMDLQVTNVSKLSVSKNGLVTSAGTGFSGSGNGGAFSWAGGVIGNSSTTPFFQSAGSSMWFGTGGNTPIIFSALSGTNVSIDLVSDTGRLRLGGSSDTILARDAANTLGLRITGTTASVFNVYREADSGLTATSYATIDAGKTTANTLILGSMKNGLPANALTKLQINVDGVAVMDYGVTTSNRLTVPSGMNFSTAGGFDLATNSSQRAGSISFGTSSDVTIQRTATGVLKVSSASVAGTVLYDPKTIANLPASPANGMVAAVTDASAPAVGSTVASGGSAKALVWYNGANWTVIGV